MPVKEFNEAIPDFETAKDRFREIAQECGAVQDGQRIIFTEQLMRSLAGIGLTTIAWHAERGSLKAAMYLVDRNLGTPDQPFREQVAGMSWEEAEEALFAEFKRQGFTDDVAHGLVVAARQLPEPSDS